MPRCSNVVVKTDCQWHANLLNPLTSFKVLIQTISIVIYGTQVVSDIWYLQSAKYDLPGDVNLLSRQVT